MLSKELLLPALATIIAIVVYSTQIFFVAKARSDHGIQPPKTTGHNEDFDRVWRVHYNTLEQMPIFLPLLWIFALTTSAFWGGILGLLWSIGRVAYMFGYYKSVKARSNPIAYISSAVVLIFLIGSLWSVIGGLVR